MFLPFFCGGGKMLQDGTCILIKDQEYKILFTVIKCPLNLREESYMI